MRNPWAHDDDDLPDAKIYQSRAKLLGALIWVILLVLIIGIVLLAGDQLTVPSLEKAATLLLRGLGAVLIVLFALPIILKLLKISWILTAAVVGISIILGGRFLVINGYLLTEEYQLLSEIGKNKAHNMTELLRELSTLL
jgi:hypothetical protein